MQAHELWYGVKRNPYTRITKIKGVVGFAQTDVDIEPLHGLVGSVIDAMGVANAIRRTCRPLKHGGAPVNRELGFAVENDKHFLALVMEVLADSALGQED